MARESVGTCRAWADWAAITQVHKGNQEQEGITELQRPETACANTTGVGGRSKHQERRRTKVFQAKETAFSRNKHIEKICLEKATNSVVLVQGVHESSSWLSVGSFLFFISTGIW